MYSGYIDLSKMEYSKTCLKRHLKTDKSKGLNDKK